MFLPFLSLSYSTEYAPNLENDVTHCVEANCYRGHSIAWAIVFDKEVFEACCVCMTEDFGEIYFSAPDICHTAKLIHVFDM
jgi:hypothetical protein